jgi:hypothetical protein
VGAIVLRGCEGWAGRWGRLTVGLATAVLGGVGRTDWAIEVAIGWIRLVMSNREEIVIDTEPGKAVGWV